MKAYPGLIALANVEQVFMIDLSALRGTTKPTEQCVREKLRVNICKWLRFEKYFS